MDDILARLEHAKKTIIDLEKKKLDLTQEERRLKERYDEEELRFKTTVSILLTLRIFRIPTSRTYFIFSFFSWMPRGRRPST